MERPLEIAFHNMTSSASLEEEIRDHVDKLEKHFGRLTACRVSVEALHRQHRTGNIYEVHITMSVPGRDLAISREPHKPREHYAHPDVRVCLREAFRAAERQLQVFKDKRGQPEKVVGANASALTGQVALIEPGQDHGFILTNTGSQLYFHRDSVTDGRFDDLHLGDIVHYVEEEGDAGPTATKVRLGKRA